MKLVCIKYFMCDIISGVSSLAVFEASIRVKSTYLIKSCLTAINRQNMEMKDILHKPPSKRSFRHRIHSLLRRPDAGGSADIIYHISIVCGSGIVIEVRK